MQVPEQAIIAENGEGTMQYLRAGPQEHRGASDAANGTWPPGMDETLRKPSKSGGDNWDTKAIP